jgi:hypothetical protein
MQGVQIDQEQILRTVLHTTESRTIGITSWLREVSDTGVTLADGSRAWVKTDAYVLINKMGRNEFGDFLASAAMGIVLSTQPAGSLTREKFVNELAQEISHNRIPLVGVDVRGGGRHMVTVVGVAFPLAERRYTPDSIVGFMIYDPWTGAPLLVSVHDLAEAAVAVFPVATSKFKSTMLELEGSAPFSSAFLSAPVMPVPLLGPNPLFGE